MSADPVGILRAELHAGERGTKQVALGVALLLHAAVLFIPLPAIKSVVPEKTEHVFYVRPYVPPPPRIERREVAQVDLQRRLFVPDETPGDPEPIREPKPEIVLERFPPDATFLLVPPDTPPARGPLAVDGERVTSPERIEASAVQPVYPEIARLARAEGRVIVQATILEDGSVADVEILSCSQPGMQFEEAAIEAVKQWRYRPALQGGRPVDVYFTVVVQFELS
jgi:protein TonB